MNAHFKINRSDWILSILVIALGAAIYAYTYTFEQTLVVDSRVTAEFFPRIVAVGMIVLAVMSLVRCWRYGSDAEPEGLWALASFKRPFAVALMIAAYTVALVFLGFIIDTFLLGALLMYVTGNRKFMSVVLFPALLSLAVDVVFYKFLVVPLPEGLFYF